MGNSVSAFLWHGLNIGEEGLEFPWTGYNDSYDIDDWWRDINGFKSPFELYGEDGEYLNHTKPSAEQINKYYDYIRSWDAANPLPIHIVNIGSSDYPVECLAVPGTVACCCDCEAKYFEPTKLVVPADDLAKFNEFIQKYCPEFVKEELGWYFSAYWG